jgi:succinate-acetate transporter protein
VKNKIPERNCHIYTHVRAVSLPNLVQMEIIVAFMNLSQVLNGLVDWLARNAFGEQSFCLFWESRNLVHVTRLKTCHVWFVFFGFSLQNGRIFRDVVSIFLLRISVRLKRSETLEKLQT